MLFLECSCLQVTAPTGERFVAKCDLEGGCYCQSFQGREVIYLENKGCEFKGKICKLLVTRQRSTTWQSFFIKLLRWYFNELYGNSLDVARVSRPATSRDCRTCLVPFVDQRTPHYTLWRANTVSSFLDGFL